MEIFLELEYFKVNINLGQEKLEKYYTLLNKIPIYYTALALYPIYRQGYFKITQGSYFKWVIKAKDIVQRVWDIDYRVLNVIWRPETNKPVAKRLKKYHNAFKEHREQSYYAPSPLTSFRAALVKDDKDKYEVQRLTWEAANIEVRDPITYWYNKRL